MLKGAKGQKKGGQVQDFLDETKQKINECSFSPPALEKHLNENELEELGSPSLRSAQKKMEEHFTGSRTKERYPLLDTERFGGTSFFVGLGNFFLALPLGLGCGIKKWITVTAFFSHEKPATSEKLDVLQTAAQPVFGF